MTDPLVTVSRIASEGVLLVVSHHFKKHSSEPDRPANVVACAELFVFFLRVQDQGGEECEKHPHTCTEKMILYAMYHVVIAHAWSLWEWWIPQYVLHNYCKSLKHTRVYEFKCKRVAIDYSVLLVSTPTHCMQIVWLVAAAWLGLCSSELSSCMSQLYIANKLYQSSC